MEKELVYRSTIKSRPFFYIESKKLSDLVIQGFTELEIREQVIENNIFQVKTESRKREIASVIHNRFKVLDEYLIAVISRADVRTSKLVALYAILKTDRLFFEFMHEVFSEKVTNRDLVLTDRDFNIFFEDKCQQSEVVAKWKEYTVYKLKQVYIRILFEADLLKNQKNNREIEVPIMNLDVLEYIKNYADPRFINVIVGGMYDNY